MFVIFMIYNAHEALHEIRTKKTKLQETLTAHSWDIKILWYVKPNLNKASIDAMTHMSYI